MGLLVPPISFIPQCYVLQTLPIFYLAVSHQVNLLQRLPILIIKVAQAVVK